MNSRFFTRTVKFKKMPSKFTVPFICTSLWTICKYFSDTELSLKACYTILKLVDPITKFTKAHH